MLLLTTIAVFEVFIAAVLVLAADRLRLTELEVFCSPLLQPNNETDKNIAKNPKVKVLFIIFSLNLSVGGDFLFRKQNSRQL
jgi:hypothetical protein